MLNSEPQRLAKQEGKPRYNIGTPCVNGHNADRFTATGRCVVCARQSNKKWHAENPDKQQAYARKWYEKTQPTQIEKARQYRKNFASIANASTRKWRAKNKDVVNAHTNLRRTLLLRAAPKWIDKEAIKQVYTDADYISRLTGIKHEVDHIVPLKNRWVSGLHVPWNLQIIPALQNRQKKNKFNVG